MARKLKNLKVKFISLVKMPANEKTLVLKSNEKASPFKILKMDDDRMRAYGIVYAPDQVDAQDDYADSETILKAADDFMISGRNRNVDRNHDFQESGSFVAESWIIKANDPIFTDEKPGAWAVGIQVTDDRTWDNLKKGDLSGLSLAGTAETIEKQAEENAILKWLKNTFHQKSEQMEAENMTPEETQALIDKALETTTEMLKGIGERLDALKPADPEPEPKPEPEKENKLEKAMLEISGKLDELSKSVLAKGSDTTGSGTPGTSDFDGFGL